MRYNATRTAWEAVGGAGFSGSGSAYEISLALNSAGVPYVAFCYGDGANNGTGMVMRLNTAGTAWEIVGGAGFSNAVKHPRMSLSSNGVPYVAFEDGQNGDRATIMRLNVAGNTWEIIGTAGFTPGMAFEISLALNSAGVPYIGIRSRRTLYSKANGY